ncbi:hypothetical protein Trydic_g8890 [Trypoxylus dichotomus]
MDMTLEFLQPFIELIHNEYPISQEDLEEYLHEESQPYIEGSILSMQYKEGAINYWKSGEMKRLPVESEQRKFRNVNSLRQLINGRQ